MYSLYYNCRNCAYAVLDFIKKYSEKYGILIYTKIGTCTENFSGYKRCGLIRRKPQEIEKRGE